MRRTVNSHCSCSASMGQAVVQVSSVCLAGASTISMRPASELQTRADLIVRGDRGASRVIVTCIYANITRYSAQFKCIVGGVVCLTCDSNMSSSRPSKGKSSTCPQQAHESLGHIERSLGGATDSTKPLHVWLRIFKNRVSMANQGMIGVRHQQYLPPASFLCLGIWAYQQP